MPNRNIDSIKTLFDSRLTTLEHLLKTAQTHFSDSESFLQERIVADTLPFGTQIAFTCNQPRNFALWCDNKPANNLDAEVISLLQAYEHIANTKERLMGIKIEDAKLAKIVLTELDESPYFELSGSTYLNGLQIASFFFHTVTAYNIPRMAGVPIRIRE